MLNIIFNEKQHLQIVWR